MNTYQASHYRFRNLLTFVALASVSSLAGACSVAQGEERLDVEGTSSEAASQEGGNCAAPKGEASYGSWHTEKWVKQGVFSEDGKRIGGIHFAQEQRYEGLGWNIFSGPEPKKVTRDTCTEFFVQNRDGSGFSSFAVPEGVKVSSVEYYQEAEKYLIVSGTEYASGQKSAQTTYWRVGVDGTSVTLGTDKSIENGTRWCSSFRAIPSPDGKAIALFTTTNVSCVNGPYESSAPERYEVRVQMFSSAGRPVGSLQTKSFTEKADYRYLPDGVWTKDGVFAMGTPNNFAGVGLAGEPVALSQYPACTYLPTASGRTDKDGYTMSVLRSSEPIISSPSGSSNNQSDGCK